MKKGNVLILAIAVTALLGGSVWLYAKKTLDDPPVELV